MCSARQLVNKSLVSNMVHSTYNIKINTLSSSPDNTNVQTTNFGDYKRSTTAVVLNAMNYFGQ
jgi:hypothetical protein